MDLKTKQSEGYKAMLEVAELLQPGSKQKFIEHNENEKGRIH